jgi:hypothetical protein
MLGHDRRAPLNAMIAAAWPHVSHPFCDHVTRAAEFELRPAVSAASLAGADPGRPAGDADLAPHNQR